MGTPATGSRIDLHAHYLPPRYLEMLRAAGGKVVSPAHDPSVLEKLIAGQDEAGVCRQVLSTGPHSPYLHDTEAALSCAREVNDIYHGVVQASKGRFSAFGSVPLPHIGPANVEGCRCLDELGFAGIHVGCSILGRALDDPEFDEFWQEMNRREAIVFVHPGGIAVGTEPALAGMNDFLLAVTIGSAAEMAVATLRVVVLRRRFSRIRFVMCILGGVLPFLYERINTYAPIFGKQFLMKDASRPLLDELRELYYDTTLDDDIDGLVKARAIYGFERIVLGSDAPSRPPMRVIDFIKKAGLPITECTAILDHNAARLLAHRPSRGAG